MPDYQQLFSGNTILRHIDRIYEYRKTGFIYPVTVELDLTNVCDQRCLRCSSNQQRTQSLTKQDSERIFSELYHIGIKGIKLVGGGEPTLSLYLSNIINVARVMGISVCLITNGKYLHRHPLGILLQCDWIRISLDAYDPASYLQAHGDTCFNQIIENIKDLTNKRNEIKSTCTIGIAILYDDFILSPYEAVIIGEQIGVDYVQFRPYNDYRKPFIRDYEMLRELKSDKVQIVLSDFKVNETRNYNVCHGSWFTTVIGADQKIYLCCNYRNRENCVIGDLKKESFREIWTKERVNKVLNSIDITKCWSACYHNSNNNLLEYICKKEVLHENTI